MAKVLSNRPRLASRFDDSTASQPAFPSRVRERAIVGYDDVPLAAHTTPPLTTVRQPTREQGRIAAEALVRRMESAEMPVREERVMPCELVVRASTVAE